jgi:GNAT superfamily N-acetyltransferase
LPAYTELLQKLYEEFYVDESLGLTKACFSKEIFATPDTQGYLAGNLQTNDNQHCFLAFDDDKLVGSITIKDHGNEYEVQGFYVASSYQGKGIGKLILNKLQEKYKDFHQQILVADGKAIDFYKNCGFEMAGETKSMWVYQGNDH